MVDQDSTWFLVALAIVGCGALLIGMLHGAASLAADALSRRREADEVEAPKTLGPAPAPRVSPSTASAEAAARRLAASLMKKAS